MREGGGQEQEQFGETLARAKERLTMVSSVQESSDQARSSVMHNKVVAVNRKVAQQKVRLLPVE